MGNFCKYCGRPLQEGEVCHCRDNSGAEAQTQTQQNEYYDARNANPTGQQYQYTAQQDQYTARQNQYTAQQNPYHAQQNQYHPQPKQYLPSYGVNVFAVMSLVLGILSVCMTGGVVPGVIAIIFSMMAKKRMKQEDLLGWKFAKAALILGIIGCAVWVFNVLLGLLGVVTLGMMF